MLKYSDYYEIFEDQELLKNAKKYYKRLCKKNNTARYAQPNGTGRYFSKEYGLQGMKRELRHTIAQETMYDIDMQNAQPTFLLHYCKMHNLKAPCLEQYVENREGILKAISERLGLERSEAKKLLIAVINGGNGKRYELKWLSCFQDEMRSLGKQIRELEPEFRKMAEKKNLDRDFKNIEGSVVNHVMCDLENTALMIMYDTLSNQRVEIAALVHDGLMIYKKDVRDLDKLLKLCEKEIFI